MNLKKILVISLFLTFLFGLTACGGSKEYYVTFDSNGGSLVEYQIVKENEKAKVPSETINTGYSFVEWQLDGSKYDFDLVVTKDIELKAVWNKKEIYTVTYSTDGGNELASQSVYEGELALKPSDPVKVDYTFIEWRFDGKKFDFDKDVVTCNMVLTALWQEIIYQTHVVSFENCSVSNQIVRDGEMVEKPENPTKVNNTFLGWEVNGAPYDFTTPVKGNLVITAKWENMNFEYSVSSVTEFNNIAKKLSAGDTVIFEDGNYSGTSLARIESYINGTMTQKITIKARNVGKAVINETVNWQIHGSHITISGFMFKDGYPKSTSGAIAVYGDYVRLTNITMDAFDFPGTAENNYSDGKKTGYVSIQDGAKFAEVDHCTFINKTAQGCLLLVDKNNYAGPTYAHIHDNYFGEFHNVAGLGNEYETIRVGISSMSQTDSYTIIENNFFENIDGETELISIKSCRNIVRDNLILNCAGAITLRHGNTNLVEGNVILGNGLENSNGIRVFDSYHVIRNNYISGIKANSSTFYGGIVIHNGNNAVGKDGNSLSGQWTASNILIENNSFVDNDINICLGDSRYEVAPGNLTLKNNLVYSKTASAIRQYAELGSNQKSNIATNVTYINEYYFAETLGLVSSDVPSGINISNEYASANLTTLENGLKYTSLAGASNLNVLSKEEVGVEDIITESANYSYNDYKNNFKDWPFKAIYVDIPEPEDMFTEENQEFLEDDLSNWKLKGGSLNNHTFEGKTVMQVTAGVDSTSNTVEVGELNGYVAVSFDVYSDYINRSTFGLKLYNGGTSSDNEVSRIKIEEGVLNYQYSTGTLSDGTLKTSYYKYGSLNNKEWNNITIVFVTELDSSVTMKANIYINGVLQNESPVAGRLSSDMITHVGFYSDSKQLTNDFYIDNLRVVSKETNF